MVMVTVYRNCLGGVAIGPISIQNGGEIEYSIKSIGQI